MIIEFDGYELDTDRLELRNHDQAVHVEPQVFEVLRYLVEHRDRVVSKEELLDNVWGGRFVSESALTSRIKAARQAVGDNGRNQRVIGTSHGRGYRFLLDVVERATAGGTSASEVRYTRSGPVNIAYEVTGAGPIDIVLVAGFVSHLELDWRDPRSAAFLGRLGRIGRLIRFDKRGTGLSDRPPGLPDLETRMDDVRAVMDAVGSERAVVFGYSEGGPMAALFAATYPARTRALVLYGTYAKRIRTPDYPWAPTLEERLEHALEVESEWGTGFHLQRMCPSADAAMAAWWQRRCRAAASPGAARALIEMNSRIDVRDVLPTIHVPALVMHRTGDTNSRIEEGRYIAELISGAQFVGLAGADHVPWIDADQVLDPIESFIRNIGTQGVAETTEPGQADRTLATILFTDIVESTRLNADLGDARWRALLDRHDALTREIVEAWQGRWVKSTGDGVLAVFEGPARALRAAVAARDRLAQLGIRIRCGVHASEIERRGDGDVVGLGVTIAARLVALAECGDIVATSVVRDLTVGSGVELVERGVETLKGVPGAWPVWSVATPERVATTLSPAPTTPAGAAANLPQPTDLFLGREDDLDRLARAVEESRIVTLGGPGGVGKTRLALEFARVYGGDVVFIDLSRVTEPNAVAGTFLATLGASPRRDVNDTGRVVESLEFRSVLLVVDNCEQVVDEVARVVQHVVRGAREVRVLTTSRQALSVTGEQVLVVAPLTVPPPGATDDALLAIDAVRLFCDRSERGGAVLDDLSSVAELCRRLDGIPLALELAAARTRAFSPQQILDQLDEGWTVSVARRSSGPEHHLSLDDTIEWSARLLHDEERSLLLTLSTFRGPFDLAAVAATAGTLPLSTADHLAQLVDKSLLQATGSRAGQRFRLLETVRSYAAARLAAEDAMTARDRHAAYFASEVDTLAMRIPGPDDGDALARLGVEFDDVHAAFEHAMSSGDVDLAARLAVGPRLSISTESARWASVALRAVALAGIEQHPLYVAILANAAWGAVLLGDLPAARAHAEEGIAIVGDPAGHPRLCWIWPQATGRSFEEGAETCVAGAKAARERRDRAAESFLLATAALYQLVVGDEQTAAEAARAALDLAQRIGSRTLRARAAGALSYAILDSDPEEARRASEEVLEAAPPGDFHPNMAYRVLAFLAWRDGDSVTAAEHATRASLLIRDQGDRYVQAAAVRQLAVMIGDVDARIAAELLGVADGIVPGITVIARDAAADRRLRIALRDALGAGELARLLQYGRRHDGQAAYETVQRALTTMRRARR